MLTLGFQVQGQERLSIAFRRVSDSLTDKGPLWKALANVFYGIENHQFQSGGRSNPWAENSPKTVAYKVRKYGSFEFPMVATGATRKSLQSRNAAHSVYQETADSLTMGTDLPYPKYHMGPYNAGTGNIKGNRSVGPYRTRPARKVIDIVASDLPVFQKQGAKVYRKAAREAGFKTSVGSSGFVQTEIDQI